MDNYQNSFMAFPGITPEEMNFLQHGTADMTDSQKNYFLMIYSSKRKNPQDLLLFTLLGFIWIAGIQRFMVGQTGMGILYLLTGGFCYVGTIVDLINNKNLANDYNYQMAYESFQITRMNS